MNERTEKLNKWLEKHVTTYPTPRVVTLSAFEVDWDKLSGSFKVAFDDVLLPEKLKFGIDQSGRTKYYLPMWHSPLGMPCSYKAIEISDKTSSAILKALHSTIPRVTPCGLNRETGQQTYDYTPIHERIIDQEAFALAVKNVTSDNYSISVGTETL